MTRDNYILDDKGRPQIERDLIKWASWIEKAERHVADDWVGECRVSTVFLGLDHNFGRVGPPILWETMVFNGPLNEDQTRCAGSREQAEAMHARMVERVRAAIPQSKTHK